MKKSTRIILIVIGSIIALGIIGKTTGLLDSSNSIAIDTTQVTYGSVSERISASGTIYPIEELRIAPDVSGEIIELLIEEGDSVTTGQLLAKIRPDNYINALQRQQSMVEQQRVRLAQSRSEQASANARLIPLELDYTRKNQLYKDQVISSAELENAQAAYNVQQQNVRSSEQQVEAQEHGLNSTLASLREAQQNLRLTKLLAPISGRITRLLVQEGERVVGTSQMAGTTMFHIGDLKEMDIHANIIENDVIRINVGDTAAIDIESFSHLNRRFKGVVSTVATSAKTKTNPEEVTEFEVEIRILRSSYKDLISEAGQINPLRPGMTASIDIYTETYENVLQVPLSAVTIDRYDEEEEDDENQLPLRQNQTDTEEPQEIVYIYNPDTEKVQIRPVTTGLTGTKNIEITQGLTEGEIIASGPPLAIARELQDEQSVRIRDPKEDRRKKRKRKSRSRR